MRSARSTALASSPTSSGCRPTSRTRCGVWSPRTWLRRTRATGSSSPAWAARRSAARSRVPCSGTGLAARGPCAWITSCRRGRPPTPRCSARATPARPRRRSRSTMPHGRSEPVRSSSRPGGTLAASARADGVPVIPLPGGFQPRAAVAYTLVVSLEVAGLCGAGEGLHSEVDVAAAHAERLVTEWGPDGDEDSLAKSLARGLSGTVPQIAGAGLTAPIAYGGRPSSTRTRRPPHSPTSCRSSITMRSRGGRAHPRWRRSAPCSWMTRICIRASANGSN